MQLSHFLVLVYRQSVIDEYGGIIDVSQRAEAVNVASIYVYVAKYVPSYRTLKGSI